MLHADDHVFGFSGDVLEDVAVVHFASKGFLTTGVIAALEIGDF